MKRAGDRLVRAVVAGDERDFDSIAGEKCARLADARTPGSVDVGGWDYFGDAVKSDRGVNPARWECG